jgi:ADP-heptose:LPS heptosyltransferase
LRSTSCKQIAQQLLESCLAGDPPRHLPPVLIEEPCAAALFGIFVEGLADRFDPLLCADYARLFSQAISQVVPGVDAGSLVAHYERARRVRRVTADARRVFVLSRITLGADVAVSSVLIAAAKQRFPYSQIVFVGPAKNYQLFAADRRLHHIPVEYRRGSLRDRLAVWQQLEAILDQPDSIVVDPDSRLTQLGLLPVCPEDRYHLFESRAYGGDTSASLPELAASWAAETFGVSGAKPFVALDPPPVQGPYIAVSLGVGENPAKRLPDPFEERLLKLLHASTGLPLRLDRGAGGEEAARVTAAAARSGAPIEFWEGSFAGFARLIAGASLYVGYDSAGQHVASARRVPLISIFAGFPAGRMFDRWSPVGAVVRVDSPDLDRVLAQVQTLLP